MQSGPKAASSADLRPRILHRLTYANVVSTLCLFLLLGGATAYAAATIGSADIIDESILSQDVKNAEVKSPDIASNAIGTGKIQNDQVFSADVRDDTLPDGGLKSSDIATGAIGSSEIANNAVGSSTVFDHALGRQDIAFESLSDDHVVDFQHATHSFVDGASDNVPSTVSLGAGGPFTFTASCNSFNGLRTAKVLVTNTLPGWSADSTGASGVNNATNLNGGVTQVLASLGPTANPNFQTGEFSLAGPPSGETDLVNGEVTVATNRAGEPRCDFAVTRFGP